MKLGAYGVFDVGASTSAGNREHERNRDSESCAFGRKSNKSAWLQQASLVGQAGSSRNLGRTRDLEFSRSSQFMGLEKSLKIADNRGRKSLGAPWRDAGGTLFRPNACPQTPAQASKTPSLRIAGCTCIKQNNKEPRDTSHAHVCVPGWFAVACCPTQRMAPWIHETHAKCFVLAGAPERTDVGGVSGVRPCGLTATQPSGWHAGRRSCRHAVLQGSRLLGSQGRWAYEGAGLDGELKAVAPWRSPAVSQESGDPVKRGEAEALLAWTPNERKLFHHRVDRSAGVVCRS